MHPFMYPELIESIRQDRIRYWRRRARRPHQHDPDVWPFDGSDR